MLLVLPDGADRVQLSSVATRRYDASGPGVRYLAEILGDRHQAEQTSCLMSAKSLRCGNQHVWRGASGAFQLVPKRQSPVLRCAARHALSAPAVRQVITEQRMFKMPGTAILSLQVDKRDPPPLGSCAPAPPLSAVGKPRLNSRPTAGTRRLARATCEKHIYTPCSNTPAGRLRYNQNGKKRTGAGLFRQRAEASGPSTPADGIPPGRGLTPFAGGGVYDPYRADAAAFHHDARP